MAVNHCPLCERYWDVPDGTRPTLCSDCTLADVGVRDGELALMTEFHLSVKALQSKLEKYGPPHVSPKEWLTPRARLRPLSRPRTEAEGGGHYADEEDSNRKLRGLWNLDS